jgi:transcriptional regulator with XRE-family HTH domain
MPKLKWTPECGAWVAERAKEKGLNLSEMARRCGVNRSTVSRWIKGTYAPRLQDQREDLAQALGHGSFDEMYEQIKLDVGLTWPRPFDFRSTAAILQEVDDDTIEYLERHNPNPERIRSFYQGGIEEELRDKGRSLQEFTNSLKTSRARRELWASRPTPGLVVDIAPGCSEIMFMLAGSDDPIRIPEPRLLWDCACDTPSASSGDSGCPIHAKALGVAVEEAFFGGSVVIRYQDTEVRWCDCASLWPPSIDSFHMLDVLKHEDLFTANIETILDIGSGTGFLGIAVAQNNRQVRRLDLSDWLLLPMLYGATNWEANRAGRRIALGVKLGLFLDWLKEGTKRIFYDLVICNPPYLPLVADFPKLAHQSTVADTLLLEWVIANGPALGKQVYVQFSDIAMEEAQRAAEGADVRLVPVDKTGKSIPFRVRHAFQAKGYLETLIEKRGLELRPGERHPYWHCIRTYRVERK